MLKLLICQINLKCEKPYSKSINNKQLKMQDKMIIKLDERNK